MAIDADDPIYYVISGLHIGGDEQLEEIEFLDELLEFLEQLETTDENVELIINGDAFGLWGFTKIDSIEKFDHLEKTYPELFEQFRATGENAPITMLPVITTTNSPPTTSTSSGSPSTTSISFRTSQLPDRSVI